ncbi:uncharacterized protein PITG_01105 [Phytophthora infestans T30-4]|uniref:Ras-GAP domain-containing protein n=1 Tax=Phytophthora infestans (strain T30-4) TaxID=403677 RepID=D0MSG9_PHYIT|nr:uncharacterized protein PITG_01105 [Phytophthora infestans T30-4]EEY58438.1 hypothetical protein PITG_01105 [Phytophthora infestans T30-4]|eukprot:XP_002909624.1 hypothetical protein PITG_01105 [Phytophthora infestans T30-4]
MSTLLVLIAGWLVVSGASCFSIGFCCCCCSQARKKRRQKFEQQQRLFQAQVAQNDFEYSILLKSLADLLLEPNLLVSRCVLESCLSGKSNRKQTEALAQAFILRSLMPLLESERQGTRFVFQLMAIEYSEGIRASASSNFQRHGFLTQHSTASKALAGFYTVSDLGRFLEILAAHVGTLPVEIVILCRACVRMVQRNESDQSRQMELDAVHLVFFSHFLGPAMVFPRDGAIKKQNPESHCRLKYETLLGTISQSPAIESEFDPKEAKGDVDCELMGMCLMNIHSVLDSFFPEFKRKIIQTPAATNTEQIESLIALCTTRTSK